MKCRSLHLVDDDPEARRAVGRALAELEVEAWPFAGPAPFLEMLPHLPPAPVIFAIRADAPTPAFALLGALAACGPDWPAVAMSAESDTRIAVETMKRGAVDFLQLPVAIDRLEEALAAASDMFERSGREQGARREAEARLAALSPREREVAAVLIGGRGNKAAAYDLGLSVRTVEMHRSRLLRKLGVRTLAEAAVLLAHAGAAAPASCSPPALRSREGPPRDPPPADRARTGVT